ncbi:Leg1-related protein, partial [Salmonella enterica]|nr:Leg1-related protein [Salmonella enterica]
AETSNLSTLYPPFWEASPSLFADYESQRDKIVVNPWIYPERLGLYRILLNKTAKYFERFGENNEQNFFWGLPLQHGWQFSSGRLADPTKNTDCGSESDPFCISVDSWWADINYFLSVLPALAAVDSGIMGVSADQLLLLQPPKDKARFCTSVSSCQSAYPEPMKRWKAVFQQIQLPSQSFDNLLKYLWAAHTSSIEEAFKVFEDRFAYYSKPEVDFQKSWWTTVEYLGSLRFPTTLIRTHEFQEGLPPRVLVDGDKVPFIRDFTDFQNTFLLGLNVLYNVDHTSGSSSLTLWKILMAIPGVRSIVQELSETLVKPFTS